jgi:hypothetical protein
LYPGALTPVPVKVKPVAVKSAVYLTAEGVGTEAPTSTVVPATPLTFTVALLGVTTVTVEVVFVVTTSVIV